MKAGDILEFKDKVKTRRLELNLTLEQVAKAVGVSTPTIQRYETGDIKNIRRDKIKLLADALQVSPSYLMDWADDVVKEDANIYMIGKNKNILTETSEDPNVVAIAEACRNLTPEETEELRKFAERLFPDAFKK